VHFEEAGASHVLHRCDVPCCVNPAHLFLGSHADNMADMKAKNRARGAAGEKNFKAKLSAEQVAQIRLLLRSGQSCNSIAKLLGVVHSTISRIKRGDGWERE
jgi:DNA invertase Pin-like site-specific DNA recombinase